MKRNFLILLVCLLNLSLFGQTLHLQIGPSFSKLNWKNSMVQDIMFNRNVTGFNASIGVEYLNLKYFNLNSTLGFIQKGGKDSISVTGPQGENESKEEFKIKLNYLTINTTVEFKVPIKEFITPYIFIGPRLDYLISYKEKANFIKQFDEINQVNKYIYGFIAGVGINFQIKKIQLGAVFDYYLNINKLVDYTSDKNVSNKISDNTYTLSFQVGYKL
jgi:Outer membrane protein beta-barrel domain